MTLVNRKHFVAGTAATFASINVVRTPAQAAQFEFKFGTNSAANDPKNVDATIAATRIFQQSGGRVKITVYPNNALGADNAMLTQVRSGALEMMTISGVILGNVVPVTAITSVAFAFSSLKDVFAAIDGTLGDYIKKEVETKGLVIMPKGLDNGFRQVTTWNKPIKTVDDLSGMKIRTPPGRMFVDIFNGLGATATPIEYAETYAALQTHVVDGEENTYISIALAKLNEVQKYLSVTNHMWDGFWVVCNPDKWQSLGPELQKIVSDNMVLYATAQRHDNRMVNEATADKLQREGMVFNTADAPTFRKKLVANGLYTHWKSEFGPTAWALLERYSGPLS